MSNITFQRLSPERRSPQSNSASAGGACCCCCCCLHTVGGLVGAATAFPLPAKASGPEKAPLTSARKPYWISLLACSIIVGLLYPLLGGTSLENGLWILAFCGPAVQLAASLFAAIAILLGDKESRKSRLWHLGKISLFALLAGAMGLGAMMAAGNL